MADRHFEHGQPLQEVGYGQVAFAPGLHEAQLEQTMSVLLDVDEDSLLKSFRRYAGLPDPGCALPGHYGQLDAESFGSILSAFARYHAITGDERARAKLERLLDGLDATVEPTGKIFPPTAGVFGDAVSTVKYSRIVRALLDAHRLAGYENAFPLLSRLADAMIPKLNAKVGGNSMVGWNLILPEAEFLAWQHTGDARHLDIATRHLYHDFFDRLARGENCLADRNALAHMDALNSAAKAYLVFGDEHYLDAVKNCYAFVEEQSYATGGWGPNECFIPQVRPFGEPVGADGWMGGIATLADSLTRTHWHFQTPTCADAHFNVGRYLLRITKGSVYGDSMERVMYNTVLGALPLQANGMAFCNADYHEDARKSYFDNYGWGNCGPEWPLEAGVLPLVATDYRINTYFTDDEGVYVNWFIPSTVTWQQDGAQVSLAQAGAYPLGDRITFTVDVPSPRDFAIRLRIPAWADRASVSLNGGELDEQFVPGEFAVLRRAWTAGDQIDLVLPRELTLKPIDSEHPDVVALVYEPLVLFAVSTETPRFTREQLLSARRDVPDGVEWNVDVGGRTIRFLPFWAFGHERYSTYFTVSE